MNKAVLKTPLEANVLRSGFDLNDDGKLDEAEYVCMMLEKLGKVLLTRLHGMLQTTAGAVVTE
jgi:hypothetical protein